MGGTSILNVEQVQFFADTGNDVITGGVGNDTIDGDAGADTLKGSTGNDTLYGAAGNDSLDGGGGDDSLFGDLTFNIPLPLLGNDTLIGGAGNDSLYSGTGIDQIDGGDGVDFAFVDRSGLTGNITADFSKPTVKITLPDGTSIINVEQVEFRAGSGNDAITGGASNDTLYGGDGTDTLTGGAGNDTFVVGGPVDLTDSIQGGEGTADTLNVQSLLTLRGFNSLVNGIEVWSGNSNAVIGTGAAERFDLSGLIAVTGLLWLDAASGNDTVIGSLAADDLRGGTGTDTLAGGAGNDTLTGGAGNDTLDGRAGTDTSVFSGLQSNYSVTNRTGGGHLVQDLRTGAPDGTDVVLNDEVLRFSDARLTLTPTNRAPGAVSDSTATVNRVAENAANGTLVGVTALASDPDAGDSLTYSLVNNAGGRFAINASTGVVSVANGALLDFETATSHGVTVRATDPGGLSSQAVFTVAVTDVAEGGGTSFVGTPNADGFTAPNASNWTISGLDGNDNLTGAGGNDTVNGGLGTDTVSGGGGNDTFLVRGTEAQADSMQGGAGTDILRVEGTTALTLAGFDTLANGIEVWSGNARGVVGTGAANRFDFSGLSSVTGLTSLDGAGGNDTVIGSSFADNLLGGVGNDSLTGGGSNDRLTGGAGNDLLTGGTGNDTFIFASSGTGRDQVNDFAGGAGAGDVIEWHGQFANFAAVQAAADVANVTSPFGANFTGTVITSGADELWLANISKVNLQADDFAFV